MRVVVSGPLMYSTPVIFADLVVSGPWYCAHGKTPYSISVMPILFLFFSASRGC